MAASSGIPPPSPLEVHGDAKSNWEFFEEQWSNYEIATELHGKTAIIRLATLKSIIGKEGMKILQHLPMTTEERLVPAIVLQKLREHFTPQTNIVFERYQFFSRNQEAGESVDTYVTVLRKLASTCDFGDIGDSLIRDRIVLGTTDNAARSRMLRDHDLNLSRAIDACRISEQTEAQLKKIHPREEEHHINYAEKKWKPQAKKQCNYCGSSHKPRSCPAYGAKCNKCGKQNHFSKVCKSTDMYKASPKKLQSSYRKRETTYAIDESDEETSDEEYEPTIQAIDEISTLSTQSKLDKWTVPIQMIDYDGESWQVKCQIDTGSSCNVMSKKNAKKITGSDAFNKTATKLRLYDGTMLKPIGKIVIPCDYKRQSATLTFQIVETDRMPLLSAQASQQLKLITLNTKSDQVNSIETTCYQLTKDEIIEKYKDVFDTLGCLPGEYHIEMDKSRKPVQQTPRRCPIAMRKPVEKVIKELVKRGVLKPVEEPTEWISSMVAVKKTGTNKIRICLDPKDLNKAIKRPRYSQPTIEEILPQLAKAKVFSVLDAKDGFWQVKLDEESSLLTTFWTPLGRMRWLRMPFGICSASEEYQRRQTQHITDLQGVEVVADDHLVYGCGDTIEDAIRDHDTNLQKLLQRAREVGLKFNSEKMRLRVSEINYMGHLLTANGLQADPKKVEAVKEAIKPTDVKSLQRFLGFVNYMAKFIPHLSTMAEPLRRLTCKGAEWMWQSSQEEAIQNIKKAVIQDTLLKYYDLGKDTTIQCDASETGLGAAIMQDGCPVAYASRSLTSTERRYAQIEKECLAIVFACTRFDQFIYGKQHVAVESDHKPLETIFKKSLHDAPRRLQGMLLKLQKYNIGVTYKRGTHMHLADYLSRAQLQTTTQSEEETEAEICFLGNDGSTDFSRITDTRFENIRQAVKHDQDMQTLKTTILCGWPETKNQTEINIRHYWQIRDELTVQNGIIFRGNKVIIPKLLQQEMLTKIHISHLGPEANTRKAKDVMYWPGMSSQIKDHHSNCSLCNEYLTKQGKEPLISHPIPDRPWSRLGMDLFHHQSDNFLVLVDYYSDYWELDKLEENTKSRTIIECCKRNFARHDIPDVIVQDGGPQLDSEEF
jgi:hypothetical protein